MGHNFFYMERVCDSVCRGVVTVMMSLHVSLTSTSLTSSTLDSDFVPGSSLCLMIADRTLNACSMYTEEKQGLGAQSKFK